MSTRIYWFRNDLRLHDHPGLRHALAGTTQLLPVYCHDPRDAAPTPWGFAHVGPHRRRFLTATLADLRTALAQRGSALLELQGRPRDVLPALALAVQAREIVCEAIEQPAATAEVLALRDAGIAVTSIWLSSLLDPQRLPFQLDEVPRHFTPFRQLVEKARVRPDEPFPAPGKLPPLPKIPAPTAAGLAMGASAPEPWEGDARSSFPYQRAAYGGGETAALAHLERYFSGALAPAYKSTRNQLSGINTSTKFSPWLALGALSPRVVAAALRGFEAQHGPSEGSYAIWFEMLWRDFFRFLVLRERARAGLPVAASAGASAGASAVSSRRSASSLTTSSAGGAAPGMPRPDPAQDDALERWRSGRTGVPLVDAGMRELAATGFLSNRLRQLAASYLINELRIDAAAGAAWFAAQLLDYDPYSNDGNWRYIAGTGADPRGGRHFNIEKQTRDHDPDGQFRVLWGTE